MQEVEVAPVKLTQEEEEFCLSVVEFAGNYQAAYQSVYGVKAKAPTANALILMRRPEIEARIRFLHTTLATHEVLSKLEHLHTMARIRDEAIQTGALKVAAQCEIARGTVAGFYAKKDDEQKDNTLTVLVRVNGQNVAVEDHRKNNTIDMPMVAIEDDSE